MLNKRSRWMMVSVLGLSALASCAQGGAETTVAGSVTEPGVVEPSLAPVDPSTVQLLDSLQEPSEDIPQRGRNTDEIKIFDYLTPLSCKSVDKWLGSPLPRLTGLVEEGYTETCGTNWGDKRLPDRGGSLENGDPIELDFYALYLPKSASIKDLSFAEAEDAGLINVTSYFGPNIWPHDYELTSAPNDANGGHVDLKVTNGPNLLGVQNQGDRTRLAWVSSAGKTQLNVTMWSPLKASDSYRLLLANSKEVFPNEAKPSETK